LLSIEISDEQPSAELHERLRAAVEAVLVGAGVTDCELSLAIVDDPTIHALNREFLDHDEPTDVLSFLFDRDRARLEGEIVVSRDTAAKMAPNYGWQPDDELLLYVIHGALHLIGFDDTSPEAATTMREEEPRSLRQFGLDPKS